MEKVDKISGRVRFKTVYDPRFPAISGILKKHHKIMVEKDNRLQKTFNRPSVVCYSRLSRDFNSACKRCNFMKSDAIICDAGAKSTNSPVEVMQIAAKIS